MSNSRSFRRNVKAGHHVRPAGEAEARSGGGYAKGHVPWNKGRALTTSPSLGTTRRWLQACVDEGWAERETAEPNGKPGRPPIMYKVTEKGLARPRTPPEVWKVQMQGLRRWENAKLRNRMQRGERNLGRLRKEEARLGRRLTVATNAAEQAKAELESLNLAAEMVMHATETLLASGSDEPAALHPEEVDALVEYGCAIRQDDGILALNPAWLQEYECATAPTAAPAQVPRDPT